MCLGRTYDAFAIRALAKHPPPYPCDRATGDRKAPHKRRSTAVRPLHRGKNRVPGNGGVVARRGPPLGPKFFPGFCGGDTRAGLRFVAVSLSEQCAYSLECLVPSCTFFQAPRST